MCYQSNGNAYVLSIIIWQRVAFLFFSSQAYPRNHNMIALIPNEFSKSVCKVLFREARRTVFFPRFL